MPIWTRQWPFLGYSIEAAPLDPGVFGLWKDGELIFIGAAVNTIRECLMEHYKGVHGAENRLADHYTWEVAEDPEGRKSEVLAQYQSLRGKWPRLNKT